VARLILDTGVLVSGARGRGQLGALARTDDIAIPAVAVAEYLVGTMLDTDPGRSAAHRAFLEQLLQLVPVLGYDEVVAEHHAELLAHTQRAGEPRGVHDLIVAAIARSAGRAVVTTDKRARFGELPGVEARIIET
jgi:tRNA(fMet)-specific endonuclease VapC